MPSEQKRKFQVCNGYLMETEQLARVLHVLHERGNTQKIDRSYLIENTGLSNRQIESIVSIGCAMGLIIAGRQILTEIGALVAAHDTFIESKGTLEWCHYAGAGSYRNLIWHEIFNTLLPQEKPLSQAGWIDYFRDCLAGQYTERTIGKHLYEEVRFIVDCYLNRNFKKLELLHANRDETLCRRRYANPEPLVLAAMVYDCAEHQETRLLQVHKLASSPGSPAIVFAMDEVTFRFNIEQLHDKGWIRYERTHDLNQMRLLEKFKPIDFLKAYYEGTEPTP